MRSDGLSLSSPSLGASRREKAGLEGWGGGCQEGVHCRFFPRLLAFALGFCRYLVISLGRRQPTFEKGLSES